MSTFACTIDVPPTGELERNGDGSAPTDAQMAEEMEARRRFLDAVEEHLARLPLRSQRRSGNVSQVELLGRNEWSQLNHYLLLVEVDIGDPGLELNDVLPEGSEVTPVGTYRSLGTWSGADQA